MTHHPMTDYEPHGPPNPVVSVLRRARDFLKEALWYYWPAFNNNELGEASPLQYVAGAFWNARYYTYPEVPVSESGRFRAEGAREHIDLVVASSTKRHIVLVEGKRLYDPGGAKRLCWDWQRSGTYYLAADRDNALSSTARVDRCLIATTWSDPIAYLWCHEHPVSDAALGVRTKTRAWRDLARILEAPDVTRGGLFVQRSSEGCRNWQYLLYAVARRSKPIHRY
jgi:hypothetical protein